MTQRNYQANASQAHRRRPVRRRTAIYLGLLVLCADCGTLPVMAQMRASPETLESHVIKRSDETVADARAMVEALANRNPAPHLVGKVYRETTFDAKFDWSENERVWKAIHVLIEHAEDTWPELVKHLDDERYCITLEAWSGFTYNWTVSDICREIIGRNLAEVYFRNLRPLTMAVQARLGRPKVAYDKKELKSWCEQRGKKKLFEMQIEICEWAVAQLRKPDDYLRRRVSHLRLLAWIAAIEADIESLRESEIAVHFDGWGPEEEIPYSREKSHKMRQEQRKTK